MCNHRKKCLRITTALYVKPKTWVCRGIPKVGFRLAYHSPHCYYVICSPLVVSELQLSATTLLWPFHQVASLSSWIEVNCLRCATLGKAAWYLINWLVTAYRLVFALRQVALAQLYKCRPSKQRCSERQASLKAALGKYCKVVPHVWEKKKWCIFYQHCTVKNQLFLEILQYPYIRDHVTP